MSRTPIRAGRDELRAARGPEDVVHVRRPGEGRPRGASLRHMPVVAQRVGQLGPPASLPPMPASKAGAPASLSPYPSGVPSLEGASGQVSAGRGSRVHARAQEPGAMVRRSRRAVGVWRGGRIVLPATGDPSLDVVLWRWKLGGSRRSSASETAVRLLPVKVSASSRLEPSGAHGVVIHVAGLPVQVETGTDVAYVAALIDALRSRC
jgi:hypothetical protein